MDVVELRELLNRQIALLESIDRRLSKNDIRIIDEAESKRIQQAVASGFAGAKSMESTQFTTYSQ